MDNVFIGIGVCPTRKASIASHENRKQTLRILTVVCDVAKVYGYQYSRITGLCCLSDDAWYGFIFPVYLFDCHISDNLPRQGRSMLASRQTATYISKPINLQLHTRISRRLFESLCNCAYIHGLSPAAIEQLVCCPIYSSHMCVPRLGSETPVSQNRFRNYLPRVEVAPLRK